MGGGHCYLRFGTVPCKHKTFAFTRGSYFVASQHAGYTYRIAFAEPDGSRRQRDFSAEAIRPRQSPPSGSKTRR